MGELMDEYMAHHELSQKLEAQRRLETERKRQREAESSTSPPGNDASWQRMLETARQKKREAESRTSTPGIASSSSDIAPGLFRSGLAVFGNIYTAKNEGQKIIEECLADFEVLLHAQAYVVINDKKGLRGKVDQWDVKSNTTGIAIFEVHRKPNVNVMTKNFPKLIGTSVVMHLVEDESFPEYLKASSPGGAPDFKCLCSMFGASQGTKTLWSGLIKTLDFLRVSHKGDRGLVRHISRALANLRCCEKQFAQSSFPSHGNTAVAGEVSTDYSSVVASGAGAPLLLQDCMERDGPPSTWKDFGQWLNQAYSDGGSLTSQPGVLGSTVPTVDVLRQCELMLRASLCVDIGKMKVCGVLTGFCIPPPTNKSKSGDAERFALTNSTLILNFDFNNLPDFISAGVKHNLVWVIESEKLRQLVRSRKSQIFNSGCLRIVSRVSPDGRRVCITPKLEATDGKPETDRWYILAVFVSLHQYYHLYENLRTVSKQLTNQESALECFSIVAANSGLPDNTSKNTYPALRAWMGYADEISFQTETATTRSAVHKVMGDVNNRPAVLSRLLVPLRRVFGKKFCFTDQQVQILMDMTFSCVMIRCCFGGGKTTLLLSICLLVLEKHAAGEQVCVHYMTETKSMLLEFLELLRRAWGQSKGIAPIGFHEASHQDMLEADVCEKLRRADIDVIAQANVLEKALDLLLDLFLSATDDEAEMLCMVIPHFASLHHGFLHRVYYVSLRKQQNQILGELCVVVSTTSFAHKLNGQCSQWFRGLRHLNKTICLVDEVQSLGIVEVGGACALYEGSICVGDDRQKIPPRSDKKNTSSDALRAECCMAWALRNPRVQNFTSQQTLRFGEPLLKHMKYILSNLDDVTTGQKKSQASHMLPIFFDVEDTSLTADADQYIRRDAGMFSTLSFLAALEIVLGEKNVLVVCYLTRVVDDVAAFLRFSLPLMCRRLHEYLRLGEWPAHRYELDSETSNNDLRFSTKDLECQCTVNIRGPVAARGLTSDIVFILGLKRRTGDRQYQGLMVESPLLRIHYSRARKRLYPLLHDLTKGIEIPLKGKVAEEGLRLGLKRSKYSHNVFDSGAKHQLVYARLKRVHDKIWTEEMDVPKTKLQNARSHVIGTGQGFHKVPICLHSPCLSLIGTASWPRPTVQRALCDLPSMTDLLSAAMADYRDMRGWWPDHNDKIDIDEWGMDDFNDTNRWSKWLGTPQCNDVMIADNRRSDQTRRYWTKEQFQLAEVSDKEERPSSSFVYEFWQILMHTACSVQIESHNSCLVCFPFVVSLKQWAIDSVTVPDDKTDSMSDRTSAIWLAWHLAASAVEEYRAQGFSEQWTDDGWTLTGPLKQNHKEEDFVIGGERCFVKQCNSVRPYFAYVASREKESIELFHLYYPMGLERQHVSQGSLLARCSCLKLGAVFTFLSCRELKMEYHPNMVTHCMPEDSYKNGTPKLIAESWNETMASFNIEAHTSMRWDNLHEQVGSTGWDLVNHVWTNCLPGLTDDLRDLLKDAFSKRAAKAAAAMALNSPTSEPRLSYRHEVHYCRRPPALLNNPSHRLWRGQLFVGGVTAVLTPQWLEWAKVTHALGALGRYDKEGHEVPEYTAVQRAKVPSIRYYNFPINHQSQQARYAAIFQAMHDILERDDQTLLIYCKNGKDRSCFVIYSFLRVWHLLTHDQALSTLAARCTYNGNPLFCYAKQDVKLVKWLTDVLAQPNLHSEEVVEWQSG